MPRGRYARRGFTLAELMVSVGVLVLLLTMVSMIFKMATDASSKATANNAVMARLRTLEHQLRQDILGLKQDAFIGLWYQKIDPINGPRIDRMVFFSSGDFEAKADDPISIDPRSGLPWRSGVARIFYGHYNALGAAPLEDWILGRRVKLLVADDGSLPTPAYGNSDLDVAQAEYDVNEYELRTLDEWHNNSRLPIQGFFDLGGAMAEGTHPNSSMPFGQAGYANWIRRPTIDTPTGIGMHMYFLPDCAEFKVQRWVERDPMTRAPIPGTWYPEDFSGADLLEYVNGPKPRFDPSDPSIPWPANIPPQYGSWFYYDEPLKAIKVTVRLFDKNERIEGGQQFTMVFEIPGTKGIY